MFSVGLLCAALLTDSLCPLFLIPQAELQALGQHRGLSATASGHNFSMSSDGYSEPVDVQLHKSLAKATIKLGARVTTLEAKVTPLGGRCRGAERLATPPRSSPPLTPSSWPMLAV